MAIASQSSHFSRRKRVVSILSPVFIYMSVYLSNVDVYEDYSPDVMIGTRANELKVDSYSYFRNRSG